MPYKLPLPARLEGEEWKVKIFDNEIAEPPHATILKGPNKWRINLRSLEFMDKEPPARKVDSELVEYVRSKKDDLVREWNARFPHNQV